MCTIPWLQGAANGLKRLPGSGGAGYSLYPVDITASYPLFFVWRYYNRLSAVLCLVILYSPTVRYALPGTDVLPTIHQLCRGDLLHSPVLLLYTWRHFTISYPLYYLLSMPTISALLTDVP
jgi:hypothetical protein